ncbi:hypothetical protein AUQ41_08635 [Thalassospira sp. MCCC 1A02898]|nr:hypothetical protein [Thalassospira sp. MCCC 1A02898]KZC99733.1 hypothetical protein AUQ41_08635 [Thalassospira sp. MCCC 1A02898]
MFGAAFLGDGVQFADRGFARLRLVPYIPIDNRQFGDLGHHPVGRQVGATDAFAGVRMLDHLHPVINLKPDIEFIEQHAVMAGLVAIDRAGRPLSAGRAGNAVIVQALGDRARADIVGILAKYPADDLCLVFVNPAFAPDRLAIRADFMKRVIAITAPAGVASGLGACRGAAPDLKRQILKEHGRHRALKADMHFIDFTIGHGQYLDLVIGQLFVDRGNVFLIARKPVKVFGEDRVKLPALGIRDKLVDLGPVCHMRARDGVIGINAGVSAAKPFCHHVTT